MAYAGWLTPLDERAVAAARVLPLDVVQANGAGHAGTAVSLTPALHVLFQEFLRHDPADPLWLGRDRFVLSAGHASLALYVQLYLCGTGLEMADLQQTRKLGSRTPGHPERGVTPGVETSTGPLAQGLGNAVGLAMAVRRTRTLLDPAAVGDGPFRSRVWCLVSDGDLQEGLSHEAAALAGRLGLSDLIVMWDDNRISIEGDTALATVEDTSARFAAYGWQVVEVADGEDPAQVRAAFARAVTETEKPVLVRLRTRIGHPMPHVGGTARAHAGAVGAQEVAATKELLGLDPAQSFAMPPELLAHTRGVVLRGARAHAGWDEELARWRTDQPRGSALLDRLVRHELPEGWRHALPRYEHGRSVATRVASGQVLAALADLLPELWGGSADLAESTGMQVEGWSDFLPSGPTPAPLVDGRQVHFGIREHAMAAALNGIALHGLTRPVGSTYFVFSDYLRPAVRLAALMRLPATFVWSHDSVAVGEDGPTHQPVEQLWAARSIPGLAVVRPADANETVAAWATLLEHPDGPTALVLSRQALPVLEVDGEVVRQGTARGAYVLADPATDEQTGGSRGVPVEPDVVLIATGSEVSLALAARDVLAKGGVGARVVSAPCLEWFEAQDAAYRERVLPARVRARVSVEAGRAQGWYRYLGLEGRAVSVEDFGFSATGAQVMAARGVTVDAVVAAALASVAAVAAAR